MSELGDCKAAGDSNQMVNYLPAVATVADVTSQEVEKKSKESSEEEKEIQQETCCLPEKKKVDEDLARGDTGTTKSANTIENREEILNWEQEIQRRTNERDNYQKKLEEAEKKLAVLEGSYEAMTNGNGDEMVLRRELEDLKNLLTRAQIKLNDRNRLVANQENQINALTNQVSSLKEVVAITKDLLNIRNMEVKHLQDSVDSMETRMSAEREKHDLMMKKMNSAVKLNADLKKEYETQLRIFQDLRQKYEEKVTLITEEKENLEKAIKVAENQRI